MLALKLARVGKTKQPSFRLIVTEKTRDPWSRAVEILGHYNRKAKDKPCVLNKERISYWLSVGAQPTPSVHNLLVNQGILQAPKVKVRGNPKRKNSKSETGNPNQTQNPKSQTI